MGRMSRLNRILPEISDKSGLIIKKGRNFEQWRPPNDSERILRTTYDLSCKPWQPKLNANGQIEIEEILNAEQSWEINGLCDPYVFVDTDQRIYLFYAGGPIQSEGAIGMVELEDKSTIQNDV